MAHTPTAALIAELVHRGFVVSFMLYDNKIVASATSGGKTTTTGNCDSIAKAVNELDRLMAKLI